MTPPTTREDNAHNDGYAKNDDEARDLRICQSSTHIVELEIEVPLDSTIWKQISRNHVFSHESPWRHSLNHVRLARFLARAKFLRNITFINPSSGQLEIECGCGVVDADVDDFIFFSIDGASASGNFNFRRSISYDDDFSITMNEVMMCCWFAIIIEQTLHYRSLCNRKLLIVLFWLQVSALPPNCV